MTNHVAYRLLVRLLVPGLVLAVLALRTVSPACANIFGQDDRKEITNQDYPYCCIGIVEGKVGEGTSQGTGFLVGRNLVITNRHCTVHEGKPIERLYFGAGYVKGDVAKASRVYRVYRGGDNYQDSTQDWAVLELEDNLGDELGWLPLTDKLPKSGELVGYSGDLLEKLRSGTRSKCTVLRELQAGILMHDADATRGSSGGPILAMHQGRPHVVALNFGEFRDNGKVSLKLPKYEEEHSNLAIPVSGFLPKVNQILADETHNEFCNSLQQAKDAEEAGDLAEVLRSLGDAIRLQPENYSVRRRRAEALLASGDWEAALVDLAEACRLEPEHNSLSMLRAKTMFEHEQYEECVEVLNKLLKQKPNHEEALALQGKAYLMLVREDVRKSLGQ